MTTSTVNPGTIVVGYDRSEDAARALKWAAEQASIENRPLTIVHVITPTTGYELSALGAGYLVPNQVIEALREDGTNQLAEAREIVVQRFPDVVVATALREGSPGDVLVELSQTAASLVIGSRGRGRIASLLFGSVGVDVSRSAECPVVVIRPHHPGKVRRGVLVGTDCGEHSSSTVEFAYRQASLRGLPLTVVLCVTNLDAGVDTIIDEITPETEEPRRQRAESVAGMTEKFPDVSVRFGIGNGIAAHCLVRASSTMDLVVVGHHGLAAFGDLVGLGAFAPELVERSSCPVAVVCDPSTRDHRPAY